MLKNNMDIILQIIIHKMITLIDLFYHAKLRNQLKYKNEFADHKVGIIISGGNIDMPVLETIIQRGMVRTGRMTRIRVDLRDMPGTLADATRCIEDSGANIIHVHHHRTFTEQPLQMVEVEFILQTRGKEHINKILKKLESQQFKVRALYEQPLLVFPIHKYPVNDTIP